MTPLLFGVGMVACDLTVVKIRMVATTPRVGATSVLPPLLSAETTLEIMVVLPPATINHRLIIIATPPATAITTIHNRHLATPTTLVLCPSTNPNMLKPVPRLVLWSRPITMPASLVTSKMVAVHAPDDSSVVVRLRPSNRLQHLRGRRLALRKTRACQVLLPLMLRHYAATSTIVPRHLLFSRALSHPTLRCHTQITILRYMLPPPVLLPPAL